MSKKEYVKKLNATSGMTPPEKIMYTVEKFYYGSSESPPIPISPYSQSMRDALITEYFDPNSQRLLDTYTSIDTRNRDLQIIEERSGYRGKPAKTFRLISKELNNSTQSIKRRFTRGLYRINALVDFVPFPSNHLARTTWDMTCHFDAMTTLNPDSIPTNRHPLLKNFPALEELLDENKTFSHIDNLDPKTRSYLLNSLSLLFPEDQKQEID